MLLLCLSFAPQNLGFTNRRFVCAVHLRCNYGASRTIRFVKPLLVLSTAVAHTNLTAYAVPVGQSDLCVHDKFSFLSFVTQNKVFVSLKPICPFGAQHDKKMHGSHLTHLRCNGVKVCVHAPFGVTQILNL